MPVIDLEKWTTTYVVVAAKAAQCFKAATAESRVGFKAHFHIIRLCREVCLALTPIICSSQIIFSNATLQLYKTNSDDRFFKKSPKMSQWKFHANKD